MESKSVELRSNIIPKDSGWYLINPHFLNISVKELLELNLGLLPKQPEHIEHVLLVNIRAVNYKWGTFLGFLNMAFNIRSVNILQVLHPTTYEILSESLLYDLRTKRVISMTYGMEDIRLFLWNKQLWASYTSPDHPDPTPRFKRFQMGVGVIKICSIKMRNNYFPQLNYKTNILGIDSNLYLEKPVINKPEKNWLPFVDSKKNELVFIYKTDPLEFTYHDMKTGARIHHSKSNQSNPERKGFHNAVFISMKNQHLVLAHKRTSLGLFKFPQYRHKFFLFDQEWNLLAVSRLFHFGNKPFYVVTGGMYKDNAFFFTMGFKDEKSLLMKITEDKIMNLFVS